MPTTLRIVTGTSRVVGLVAADGVVGRDLGLRDRGRPQARARWPAILGDVAGGEDRAGRSVRMRSSTSTPRLTAQPGVAGELDVGRDARRDEQDLGVERAAVGERRRRAGGRWPSTALGLGARCTISSPRPSR